jgi:GNAT superfamily N-acetyltransferase
MPPPILRPARHSLRRGLRRVFSWLPQQTRFALIRRLVDCDPAPPPALELKIAETCDELEACFALLHDAYVASGFMRPHPSGLRVTVYHALPTTTTVCAKLDGRVVGTLSMVREGVFGLPLQSAFDLAPVRVQGGQVAEISALAVHPDHRRTGGTILFPLMKYMYEYCTSLFDTRHLVIAVNPDRIELYEALLQFERLQAAVVEDYAFANGAPAVGATLDLSTAPARFEALYGGRPMPRVPGWRNRAPVTRRSVPRCICSDCPPDSWPPSSAASVSSMR